MSAVASMLLGPIKSAITESTRPQLFYRRRPKENSNKLIFSKIGKIESLEGKWQELSKDCFFERKWTPQDWRIPYNRTGLLQANDSAACARNSFE